MDTIDGGFRTTQRIAAVSRRTALRGLGGGIAAALAVGAAARVRAGVGDRMANALFNTAASDDPAAIIAAYVAAVNAGDLEGILALYAEDAVHIALPSPDGSAGVCRGKEQFRMWHEQGLAHGHRVELVDGSLAVDGNQAAFAARISTDPWRALGLEALEAQAEIVVIDGRIMTHIEGLTPDSVRQLAAAREASAD